MSIPPIPFKIKPKASDVLKSRNLKFSILIRIRLLKIRTLQCPQKNTVEFVSDCETTQTVLNKRLPKISLSKAFFLPLDSLLVRLQSLKSASPKNRFNLNLYKMVNAQNFVSLFCGCGGFDLGLIKNGFLPVGGFDICSDAIQHYKSFVCPSAEEVDLSLSNPSLSTKPDVVIAGPPCQGFSTAGKRSLSDERNHLLPRAGQIAADLGAKVIAIENVSAARSGAHRVYWEQLETLLRQRGYKTLTISCNASELGLAQSRRRLLLFAWQNKSEPNLELAYASFLRPSGRLDETLCGVEVLPNHDPLYLDPNSQAFKISQRIGPGQKLSNVRGGGRSIHTWNIPEVFGPTTAEECKLLEFIMRVRRQDRRRDFGDSDPVSLKRIKREFGQKTHSLLRTLLEKNYIRKKDKHFDLCHTFNGKYRRFQWDDKACAVDTRFGEAQLFLHPNEHRPFTIREAARIQGFPDNFTFTASNRSSFRLIGNAVPPPMGDLVAKLIMIISDK